MSEPMSRAEFRAEYERAIRATADRLAKGRYQDPEAERARAQQLRALSEAATAWLELANDEDYNDLRAEIETVDETWVSG